MGTDADLIDPSAFVVRSGDLRPNEVEESATQLASIAVGLRDGVDDVASRWRGLSAHYRAPEQESVYTAMAPAVERAEIAGTGLGLAAAALEEYAEVMRDCAVRLSVVELSAALFRHRALQGYEDTFEMQGISAGSHTRGPDVPWYQYGPAVERNQELLGAYATIISRLSEAAAACANVLGRALRPDSALPGLGSPWAVGEGAASILSQAQPWGNPVAEDLDVGERLDTAVNNRVSGAAMLLGFDPVTGQWGSGSSAGAAWKWLWDGAVARASTAALAVVPQVGTQGFRDWREQQRVLAVSSVTSAVGFDYQEHVAGGDGWYTWREDPLIAGTEIGLGLALSLTAGGRVATLGRAPSLRGAAVPGSPGPVGGRGTWDARAVRELPSMARLRQVQGTLDLRNVVRLADVPGRADSPSVVRLGGVEPRPDPPGRISNSSSAPNPPTGAARSGLRAEVWANAPRNMDGVPIDPRTGEPLRGMSVSGGWVLKWDSVDEVFVARNPGSGFELTDRQRAEAHEVAFQRQVGDQRVAEYASGDVSLPGDHPPHTPPVSFAKGDSAGIVHVNHSRSSAWMEYQSQVSGWARTPDGALPEYRVVGHRGAVNFDGHVWRGHPPVEVFMDAKRNHADLVSPHSTWASTRRKELVDEAWRQLAALPPGARLEWHVSTPGGAQAIRALLEDRDVPGIDVIWTPED
ncbi:Tox-REase-5 domain-containing protein [Serinibacter salmoneus]|uniref:Restriction endonuclease fold toxin 5 of polymorphic toxin system n=1 Tax=Serinibacter salmoneus TaxID=556530 RepID=A0A2A9D2X0_9MICO|nr:Tox-REase-5 domain-containing protein [Serinibacter salmoneus]PFG21003.1 restriction endonuclease fold toxin 5 of polymorphic toxin system [Serinibacter salmoneus]